MYICIVDDFGDYGYPDVATASYSIYHAQSLGYGSGRDGILLLLSMSNRKYATFVSVSYTHLDSAGKAVAAGVGFVVACLVLLSFVFVLHWFLPKAFLRREAWRVWICRPPGQRTRSDVLVCFK